MSAKDRQKWDAKYRDAALEIENDDPSHLLALYHSHASGPRALDIACGTGRNAFFLAQHGFTVDALDISTVGLERLKARGTTDRITCQQVDLDTYSPAPKTYDLIVVANYLNRPLIPKLGAALNRGGIIILDTFMANDRNTKETFNPDFLLKQGELPTYFQTGFDILKYRVFHDNTNTQTPDRWKQAIVAKRR